MKFFKQKLKDAKFLVRTSFWADDESSDESDDDYNDSDHVYIYTPGEPILIVDVNTINQN